MAQDHQESSLEFDLEQKCPCYHNLNVKVTVAMLHFCLSIDEVTNDVTCLHSGRPLLFDAGENNTQCL